MPLIKHLKETEPFRHLPDSIRDEICASAVLKKFPGGTYIFKQHDPSTGFLYVIKEGLIEITVLAPGGQEMVVDFRNEGSFFGGTPIFTEEPYSGGARTVNPTDCYLIPEAILKRTALEYPQISDYFTRIIHSRIRKLYKDLVADQTQQALTHVEAYPFKKRLSEIMTSPVEACAPTETVREVAKHLTKSQISALLVVNPNNIPLGIITERDLVANALALDTGNPDILTAADVMSPQPLSMPPSTYMYEAMAYMLNHQIRHLPVVDNGKAVGIVTVRDLMRFRSQKAMLLVGNIREETSLEGLAAIRRELVTVARSLLSETRRTPEVMEILSYLHHGIIRRGYDICMEQMLAEGYLPPNIRYCFMIMGSGGRREMLLNPDQDNGFIYEDFPDDRLPEVEAFFIPFAEKIVSALHRIGYPLCHGKVMANNPSWRGRVQDWGARISGWINTPEPHKVRYSSILFDFAPIAGDASLTKSLHDIIDRGISEFQVFLYHMMSLDLRYKVPVGMLGRFLLEKNGDHKGELSIKQGGIIYIVDCIRMFALEKGMHELTTLDRLKGLVNRNVFSPETAEHIQASFEALSFLRLRNEIACIDAGKSPSHYLNPYLLSKSEQDLLREAFNAVIKLQEATKRHFARTPF